jgi:hypothetical protein
MGKIRAEFGVIRLIEIVRKEIQCKVNDRRKNEENIGRLLGNVMENRG